MRLYSQNMKILKVRYPKNKMDLINGYYNSIPFIFEKKVKQDPKTNQKNQNLKKYFYYPSKNRRLTP